MKKGPNQPRPDFIDNDALREIRANADWRKAFTALGLIQAPGKGNADDWWAKSPFNPDEKTPSFHMNADPQGGGRWYCHSSGQGGGLLDLVQAMQGGNIYEAGRWLLDHQCSQRNHAPAPECAGRFTAIGDAVDKIARSEKENSPERHENKPIRQSLLSLLTQQGSHPEFERRGISAATCGYLGCGYLPAEHKSSLCNRIVFQVRGVDDLEALEPQPTILTHMGRALTDEQAAQDGKWSYYKGFRKSLELYNLDQLRLDPEAQQQITGTGQLILVEGCFDVAACVEAGIRNVVASFGTQVSTGQIDKLHLLKEIMGAKEVLVWYDRDDAGARAQTQLVDDLNADGLSATGFDWARQFPSPVRGSVPLPPELHDPGDFSTAQLKWLRAQNKI